MSKIPGFLILMSVCGLHASDEFLPYAGSPTSGLRFKKKQGQEPIPPVSKEVSGQQDSPPYYHPLFILPLS